MCSGQGEHNRQVEAQRAADQASARQEIALAEAERRNQQIVESMKPKYTPPPVQTGAALNDNMGVQRKKAKKNSVINAAQGVASLRIPLNIGISSGGNGPNMG